MFKIISLLSLMIALQGCAILLGTISPVDEKSTVYRVDKPSDFLPDEWKKLDTQKNENENEKTDLVFQSKKTSSVISLNSSCRDSFEKKSIDLAQYTESLTLGISDVSDTKQESVLVSQKSALQTTVQGKMNEQDMKIQVIVLRNQKCIYDLMYVTRPTQFEHDLNTFKRFTGTFRVL